MRFSFSEFSDLYAIRFRTDNYIYDDNKTGFYILYDDNKVYNFSIDLHEDGYGGDIILDKAYSNKINAIELFDKSSRLCYGDRDSVKININEHIYSGVDFVKEFTYSGELGCICNNNKTIFRIWSPFSKQAYVNLYNNNSDEIIDSISMNRIDSGVFELIIEENLHQVYYDYTLNMFNKLKKCVDPYAKACGVNGLKSMVVDLDLTNPEGFDPEAHIFLDSPVDAVIYETSIRDFTISETSGVSENNRGKYLGFIEKNTKNQFGDSTGLDYLKELGITHVHLLPVMDFVTIDEENPRDEYNWGYDPESYFCLEGSYSCDPYNGTTRINEFKELVKTLHENNIGVVLDVVYNHTYKTDDSCFNISSPDYYYRKFHGHFSNGSGCGNELDTEKPMVRKLIIDSLIYWTKEYGIDGFRFDLMGLIDIETMSMIREELDKIDKRILIYGEGWTGGLSSLEPAKQTIKYNTWNLDERIAFFNDEYRDFIKGNTFDIHDSGYAVSSRDSSVHTAKYEALKAGIVAQTVHPDVIYQDGRISFAKEPTQTITYHSSHDNYTLHDKLYSSAGWVRGKDLEEIYRFSIAMFLTSQGIPFLMSGEEFMRSKQLSEGVFDHNSYKSPDSVNQMDWSRRTEYKNLVDYYKGLIKFRKAHSAFRINNTSLLQKSLKFIYTMPHNRMAYTINGSLCNDTLSEIAVIINPTMQGFKCKVSDNENNVDKFGVYIDKFDASDKALYYVEGSEVEVLPVSVMVIGR